MSRFLTGALLFISAYGVHAQVMATPDARGFLQSEVTPAASMKLGLGLLYEQATVAVPEWGSGRAGLTRRAEWLAAGWMARASVEYGVSTYRGTDTGYRACACKGFPRRSAHALGAGLSEYRGDGTRAFALSRFSGLAAGALATMPMLPAGYGLRDAAERSATAFAVDEGFNLLREFRREIVRTLVSDGVLKLIRRP
jgi:hypothetical protein